MLRFHRIIFYNVDDFSGSNKCKFNANVVQNNYPNSAFSHMSHALRRRPALPTSELADVLQLVDIRYVCLVHFLLHNTPERIVNRI